MKLALSALMVGLLLGGCVTDSGPQYSLGAGEKGVFTSRNAGTPIPADRIKGLDEAQLTALFGTGVLDRKDDPARALRYQSDACVAVRLSLSPQRHRLAGRVCRRLRPAAQAPAGRPVRGLGGGAEEARRLTG